MLNLSFQKAVKRIDPGFIVVLAISFLAIWPFISRPSLPQGTDAELHIFRLAELSYLLRGGEFYPRWAPNFYHGYGYPIFNYYAPLTYYLGFIAEWTPWVDPVGAVKLVFILGLLFAGIGMYGFVRDNWGRKAGYVAAAVFLYAPYVQYIDPHARGVLPETFSFGVFTLALWALDRVNKTGGRWSWLAAVLCVAAVILSHNLMGLLFYSILICWSIWNILFATQDSTRRKISIKTLFSALILGLGIAAIFWLPVIFEREAVNLNTLIGRQDNYDFHTHFLSLKEMLSPSIFLDWGATEPDFRFNLGIAQWILGSMGLLMLALGKVHNKRQLSFFAISLLILVLLMLPISTLIWENVPFLPFFQFPWRLLGAAAALLAILAGAGASALSDFVCEKYMRHRKIGVGAGSNCQIWPTAALVAFPILMGLPLSQPAPWPDFGTVDQLRMTLIENTGQWLGTTSTADYVPATVDIIPKRESSVVAPFAEGLPPDRINYANLPEGTLISTDIVRPLLTRYHINTPRDTLLRLFLFDFPGWKAKVDGQLVETKLGRPEGFLIVPVPQGEHIVEVEFGSTPDRTAGKIISFISFVFMIMIAWRLPVKGIKLWDPPFKDWPVLIGLISIILGTVLILEPLNLMHYSSEGRAVEPAQYSVYANFGDQLALLGYDISQEEAVPGDTINLILFWKAQQDLDINYQVFVHLLGPQGLVAQSDKLNPGEFPTKRWPLNKYVRDEHKIVLPEDLPSGTYEIAVGAWVQSDGWRLPLFDEHGNQLGDRYTIQQLDVK